MTESTFELVVKERPKPGTLAKSDGFYRSRLFNVRVATNDLITAATALVALSSRFNVSANAPPQESQLSNIHHELNAFISLCHTYDFDEDTISKAHYIICLYIDESLFEKGAFEHNAFTKRFHSHIENGFYSLMDELSEHAMAHIELLELMYYLLVLGYEGELKSQANAKHLKEAVTQSLMQVIRRHKGTSPKKLFINAPQTSTRLKPIRVSQWYYTLPMVLLMWASVGIGLQYLLELNARPISAHIDNIATQLERYE